MTMRIRTGRADIEAALEIVAEEQGVLAEVEQAVAASLIDLFTNRFPYPRVIQRLVQTEITRRLPQLNERYGELIARRLRAELTPETINDLVDKIIAGLTETEEDEADEEAPPAPEA